MIALEHLTKVHGHGRDAIRAGRPRLRVARRRIGNIFPLTIGSRWAHSDTIKTLVAAFKDPAVQRFLATGPAVKGILLPLDAK